MVVACPACQTRYRVDAALVVAGETSFECCQEECGHVFVYTPPVLWKGNGQEGETAPPNPPSQPESAPENPPESDPEDESGLTAADSPGRVPAFVHQEIETLPQTVDQDRAPQAEQDEGDGPEPEAEQDEETGPEPESRSVVDVPAAPPATLIKPEDEAQSPGEPSVSVPSGPAAPPVAPIKPQDEAQSPGGPSVSVSSGPVGDAGVERPAATAAPSAALLSVRNVLVLLGCVVCGYALLSYSALTHPGQTRQLLSQLPVVGSLLAAEPFSARHIRLDKLRGGFWLSKDNRRVFAVAGTALNTASVSARRVRIEGTLYNGVGEQLERQRVFCGSEAKAELLESLTVRDIATLQKFVPPQDFHIPAGRTVACLLVFTKPPGSVAEISGRVVSVQFDDA